MREYVLFRIGDMRCGFAMDSIQEINKNTEITRVHSAPSHVRGVINLRGQIVTIIDLRSKCGLPVHEDLSTKKNLVVKSMEELIGLLVDDVDDIASADDKNMLPPPAHVAGPMGGFVAGVQQFQNQLVTIFDVEKVLA